MARVFRQIWEKGEGFVPHRHNYDHPFLVVSGRVQLQTAGRTWIVGPGEAVTHYAGTILTAAALERAEIETNHGDY